MEKITLRAARVNANLSRAKAAEALKVHRTTIANWETGKTSPNMTSLKTLSEIYHYPMEGIRLPNSD